MLLLVQRTHEYLWTTANGYEDNSISSASPGKWQLDPKDSDEATRIKTWRKTWVVRSFNTTNVHADADYESEVSNDDMLDDDSRSTPSIHGRRDWLTNGNTSAISTPFYSQRQLRVETFASSTQQTWEKIHAANGSCDSTPIGSSERIRRWSEDDNSWLATPACKLITLVLCRRILLFLLDLHRKYWIGRKRRFWPTVIQEWISKCILQSSLEFSLSIDVHFPR